MKTMKKLLVVMLALSMIFCLAACGKKNEEPENTGIILRSCMKQTTA